MIIRIIFIAGVLLNFFVNKTLAQSIYKQDKGIFLFGTIVSVDLETRSLEITYPDIDSDEEKTVDIVFDDHTEYKDMHTVLELKPQDDVIIEYIFDSGEMYAKSIKRCKSQIQIEDLHSKDYFSTVSRNIYEKKHK